MNTNLVNRRQFIKSATLFAGAACVGVHAAVEDTVRARGIPIGLQLYAVRGEFEKDVPGTLRKTAEAGYKGVEFWGYAGTATVFKDYSARQLRRILDEQALKCCGMHLDLKALDPARFDWTVENNRVLGNRFLIVAAAQQHMKSLDGVKSLADILNQAAEKARAHKMLVGYHAHGFDFIKHDDRFAWDHLFSQVEPGVVMQMDVGNCLGGGGDPIAMLRKFPGRSLSIHLKEHEDRTFDSPFYKEVFELCETTGKTEWYVVEAGAEGGLGFEVPQQALQALRKAGK